MLGYLLGITAIGGLLLWRHSKDAETAPPAKPQSPQAPAITPPAAKPAITPPTQAEIALLIQKYKDGTINVDELQQLGSVMTAEELNKIAPPSTWANATPDLKVLTEKWKNGTITHEEMQQLELAMNDELRKQLGTGGVMVNGILEGRIPLPQSYLPVNIYATNEVGSPLLTTAPAGARLITSGTQTGEEITDEHGNPAMVNFLEVFFNGMRGWMRVA